MAITLPFNVYAKDSDTPASSPKVVVVFGTAGCRECKALKEWRGVALGETVAGMRLVIVDVGKPCNFEPLAATSSLPSS